MGKVYREVGGILTRRNGTEGPGETGSLQRHGKYNYSSYLGHKNRAELEFTDRKVDVS